MLNIHTQFKKNCTIFRIKKTNYLLNYLYGYRTRIPKKVIETFEKHSSHHFAFINDNLIMDFGNNQNAV